MAAQWDIAPKAECTIKNIKCEIYIINELSSGDPLSSRN